MMAATNRASSNEFSDLLGSLQQRKGAAVSATQGAVSSDQVNGGTVSGDFLAAHDGHINPADKAAKPQGMGAAIAGGRTIDRTSELYAKAQELETFMVKQMLSSMRKTVTKGGLGGDDFAGKMYEDMMYDEYAERMTRGAGFGLADAVYLQLSEQQA